MAARCWWWQAPLQTSSGSGLGTWSLPRALADRRGTRGPIQPGRTGAVRLAGVVPRYPVVRVARRAASPALYCAPGVFEFRPVRAQAKRRQGGSCGSAAGSGRFWLLRPG